MEIKESSYAVQGLSIRCEIPMEATQEQLFSALTTGVAQWWDSTHLEGKKLARDLVLEPRLGGRFYETWEDPITDRDGALLANVIQIRKGQILKLAGFFGFEELDAFSVASFRLVRHEKHTTFKFSFETSGNLNAKARLKMISFWTELLKALKEHVEHQHPSGVRSDPSFL